MRLTALVKMSIVCLGSIIRLEIAGVRWETNLLTAAPTIEREGREATPVSPSQLADVSADLGAIVDICGGCLHRADGSRDLIEFDDKTGVLKFVIEHKNVRGIVTRVDRVSAKLSQVGGAGAESTIATFSRLLTEMRKEIAIVQERLSALETRAVSPPAAAAAAAASPSKADDAVSVTSDDDAERSSRGAKDKRWEEVYAAIAEYAVRVGRLPLWSEDVCGISYAGWAMRAKRTKRAGRLPEYRIKKLEALPGWSW